MEAERRPKLSFDSAIEKAIAPIISPETKRKPTKKNCFLFFRLFSDITWKTSSKSDLNLQRIRFRIKIFTACRFPKITLKSIKLWTEGSSTCQSLKYFLNKVPDFEAKILHYVTFWNKSLSNGSSFYLKVLQRVSFWNNVSDNWQIWNKICIQKAFSSALLCKTTNFVFCVLFKQAWFRFKDFTTCQMLN